jgi:glutamyl-tRNA synthetase
VAGLAGELRPDGDFRKTKLKLTWLAASEELVPLTLVEFDHLITKRKVEEDDDFQALVNPRSRWEAAAHGDACMRALQAGDLIQLERKGYYRVDEAATKPGKPMVLFLIPDGRDKKPAAAAK